MSFAMGFSTGVFCTLLAVALVALEFLTVDPDEYE